MAKGYPAIHKESMDAIGIGYEEEADRWMGYYAYRDNLDYRVLIEELGPEKAYKIYEKIWQTMAEELLDGIMEAEGIKQISSTKDLEKISKHYWEAITCPYETEKTTETEHYGLLTACPYVESLRDSMGEEWLLKWGKDALAPCSINYYVKIAEKMNRDGKVAPGLVVKSDMDKFICTGDEKCRVRWWLEKE